MCLQLPVSYLTIPEVEAEVIWCKVLGSVLFISWFLAFYMLRVTVHPLCFIPRRPCFSSSEGIINMKRGEGSVALVTAVRSLPNIVTINSDITKRSTILTTQSSFTTRHLISFCLCLNFIQERKAELTESESAFTGGKIKQLINRKEMLQRQAGVFFILYFGLFRRIANSSIFVWFTATPR